MQDKKDLSGIPVSFKPPIIRGPDPLRAYERICENPEDIGKVDGSLMDAHSRSNFYEAYRRIISIPDVEVRTIGLAQWFNSVKRYLGYCEAKNRYRERGKELPDNGSNLERLQKEGAEDIDEKRREDPDMKKLMNILSNLESRVLFLG